MPFTLLGLDSDNGSECVNHHLVRYCGHEQITFTRSRAYRKNDNCYVEQKNNSVVRRSVGYYRYDRPEQLELLVAFSHLYRLYVNFFQPVMKLREKIRIGSRLCRHYDTPCTPYRRTLEHPGVCDRAKEALTRPYDRLHLVHVNRELNALQLKLFASALATPPLHKRWVPPADHPWRECRLESIETRMHHQVLASPAASTR